jgi:ABC-type cobalamin/Fe3+-siderophores transport system ATPase subunit
VGFHAGGIAIVPQHFRPAFGWQVRDVVLMGRRATLICSLSQRGGRT